MIRRSASTLACLLCATAAPALARAAEPQATAPAAAAAPSPPSPAPSQTVATPNATPSPAPGPTPAQAAGAAPDKPTAQPSAPVTVRDAPTQTGGVISYPASWFADMHPNTALDMIARLPGFSLDDGDAVRGFAGAAGNALIDGERPSSKSDSLENILQRIPAADVDRIELIRGGAPGIDMQGRTVLANVVRKKGDSRQLVVSGSETLFTQDGHSVPGGGFTYTQKSGPRTFTAALSRYTSYDDSVGDGRITTTYPDGAVDSEQARTSGTGGGVGLTSSYQGPLLGGSLQANLKLEETYFKQGQSYGWPTPDQVVNDRSRSHDGEIGAGWDRKWGKLELEVTGLHRQEHDFAGEVADSPGLQDVQSVVQDTGETIGRLTLRYPVLSTLTLEGGGEYAFNSLDGKTELQENGAPVVLPSSDVRVTEARGEGFLQGVWKITPRLTLEAGARFEWSTITETGDSPLERSFFYPKPRAVLTWTPDKDSQVRLRVEKKVGQLNFSDFVSSADLKTSVVNAGNPDLRPDQRWEYEASWERRFWGKGALVITATHAEITDVVDLIPVVGDGYAFDAPGNIGSGTDDTLDVELTLPLDRLHLPHAQIKSSNVWRVSQVTDPLTGDKRRISGERPWTQNTEFSQDIPRWRLTWGAIWDRVWHEDYFRLEEVDRYVISAPFVEVYGEYKPRPDLTLRLELTNLVPYTFTRDRQIYDAPRDVAGASVVEHRVIQSSQRVYFKVRKTFG